VKEYSDKFSWRLLDARRQTIVWVLASVCVVSVILVAFSPYVVGGKVLAPFDLALQMLEPWRASELPTVQNHFVLDGVTHHIPYRILSEKGFRQDGYVGWNPLQSGGTAQHANTMVLNYEWSTQLHRFLGFWAAWHVGKMLNILTAGLGMLLFLRGQNCSAPSALVGAVGFMLNTQFVVWIFFNPGLAGFGWMPWVLWALYKSQNGSARWIALAAVFLGLSMLGSTVQQLAFLVVVLACVWVGWLIDAKSTCRNSVRITVPFVVAGSFASGLAAFMIEPTVSGFFDNSRAGFGRGGVFYPEGVLQPLLNAFAMFFTPYPFILGSAQSLDLGKVLDHSFGALGFFGTVPVIIALVALFSKSVPTAAKLLMLAGALIPLTPLVGFLYHRINLLWILGGCWGAAVWLSTATESSNRRITSMLWTALAVICAAWIAASVALVLLRPWAEPVLQEKVLSMAGDSLFGMFPEWMKMRTSKLFDYLCIWNPWQTAALAGAALSIWGLTRLSSRRWLESMATPLGVSLQLLLFWFQWTPWSAPEMPYNKHPLVAVLQREVGGSGLLAQESTPWGVGYFNANMLAPSGVAVTRGYDAIQPHGMKSPTGLPWDFPGATHFLGKIGERWPDGWFEVWSDERWRLLRKPEQSVGVVRLGSGDVPLLREQFMRPTLNTMEAEVPAGATSVTLFSNWHRGWHWKDFRTGDWKPAKCSSIRSVEVEFDEPLPEDSRIYFRFDPAPPPWISAITGLSIIGVAVLGVFGRPRLAG
jgi:hypothetical protein